MIKKNIILVLAILYNVSCFSQMPWKISIDKNKRQKWIDSCKCETFTINDKYENKYKYERDLFDSSEYYSSFRLVPIVPINYKLLWRKKDTLLMKIGKLQAEYNKSKSIKTGIDLLYLKGRLDMLSEIIDPK